VPRGYDSQRLITLAVSDQALVIGDRPAPLGTSTANGSVVIIPLTISGASISWSFSNVVGETPDPAWTASDQLGFGRVVAVDGDWVAVSSGNDHAVVYRHAGATWTADLTVTNPNAPEADTRFATSLAVDNSDPAGPRALIGTQGGFSGIGGTPTPGRAELWAKGSGGWTNTFTFTPRPGNALSGLGEGVAVGLDGNRAVIGYYWAQITGAGGQGAVDDYRLEVWNLGPTPTFEAELSTVSAEGGPQAGQTASLPSGVSLAGSHVATVAWDGFSGGVTHYAAVSFDRHPPS
jgi:hypothetical protein